MKQQIIIRAAGERTEKKCIELAEQQGDVHVIRAEPFAESIRQTYIKAIEIGAEFTAVIDADVLLYKDTIGRAVRELEGMERNVFCLDGKTADKTFMCSRRAGVHIYRTDLLKMALQYVDDSFSKLKPESYIRERMAEHGFKTWDGGIHIFGQHDYEQYFTDLWRKACCQAWKLEKMIEKKKIAKLWKVNAAFDDDFKVIFAAWEFSREHLRPEDITIDKKNDFNAIENIEFLELIEKGDIE
jgi:hypothetical protein